MSRSNTIRNKVLFVAIRTATRACERDRLQHSVTFDSHESRRSQELYSEATRRDDAARPRQLSTRRMTSLTDIETSVEPKNTDYYKEYERCCCDNLSYSVALFK